MDRPAEPDSDLIPLLQSVRDALPDGQVPIGWLYGKFAQHGPSLFLLFLGVLGTLPGADTPSGIAIGIIGILMLTKARPGLPLKVAAHRIGARPARFALGRIITLLNLVEHRLHPSHPLNRGFIRRVAPLFVILLGTAMLVPIPLSNIAPALAVAMMGLALVEGSLTFFFAALTGAAAALMLSAWFVVLVIRGFGWFY